MAELQFSRRVLTTVMIALAAAAFASLLVRHPEIPLLLFGAILFAVFLDALARPLERWLPHWLAVASVTLALLGAVAGAIVWIGPRLADQGAQLVQRVPELLSQLQSRLPNPLRHMEWWPGLEGSSAGSWARIAPFVFGSLGGLFSSSIAIVTGAVAGLALAIFLALQPRRYRDGALLLLPAERRDRVGDVLDSVANALRWWIVGRAVAMGIVTLLTWIGLMLLGVPLALSLALLAGMLTFIPYVGPMLAVTPAVLVALAVSGTLALWVAGLYGLVQLVENHVVTPLAQARAVKMPPALLILAQVALGVLLGGLGLLLSSPLTVAAIVLFQAFYLQDVLGEPIPLLGEGHQPRRHHSGTSSPLSPTRSA